MDVSHTTVVIVTAPGRGPLITLRNNWNMLDYIYRSKSQLLHECLLWRRVGPDARAFGFDSSVPATCRAHGKTEQEVRYSCFCDRCSCSKRVGPIPSGSKGNVSGAVSLLWFVGWLQRGSFFFISVNQRSQHLCRVYIGSAPILDHTRP